MNQNKDAESLRRICGYETYSQAHQDLFVRLMLDHKVGGFYCEIGGSEPKQSNNTYILERDLAWSGFSLECDSTLVKQFNLVRRNPCILADATTFDYRDYLEKNKYPKQIDYLSIDIDPAETTYEALERVLLLDNRFSVITYEHDFYASGPEMMKQSRSLLAEHGYVRVVSNVLCCGRDFEDWYIDPAIVKAERYQPFLSQNIECAHIFERTTSHDGA